MAVNIIKGLYKIGAVCYIQHNMSIKMFTKELCFVIIYSMAKFVMFFFLKKVCLYTIGVIDFWYILQITLLFPLKEVKMGHRVTINI